MARIRTFKPETFTSESLAQVSVYAERTFFGLISRADDHGRVRDQPAALCGELWAVRGGRTPVDVEDDLIQLAAADLVCRYEDGEGKRYLHIVTWYRHQKINRASRSRLPECPKHGAGRTTADASQAHGDAPKPSLKAHGGFTEAARPSLASAEEHETAGREPFTESSVNTHGVRSEPAVSPHALDLGPRNLDLGTSFPSGAQAPPHRRPPLLSSSSPSTPPPAHTARPAASSVTSAVRPPSSSRRASIPPTSAPAWPSTAPRACTPAPCRASSTRP